MQEIIRKPARKSEQKKKSIWTIDNEELEKQTSQYSTLKPQQSFRGIASLILSLGLICNVILQTMLGTSVLDFALEVVVASVLILFIYLGHRWAMCLFLLSFTVNLFLSSFYRMVDGTFSISSLVILVIVWLWVASSLIKAIRVENYRKKHNLDTNDAVKLPTLNNQANISLSEEDRVPEDKSSSTEFIMRKIQTTKLSNLNLIIVGITVLMITIGGALFWWFEIRVSEIKRECSWSEKVEDEKPATVGITAEEAKRMNDEIVSTNDPKCADQSLKGLERLKLRYTLGCKEANVRERDATSIIPEKHYYVASSDREYQLCLRQHGL